MKQQLLNKRHDKLKEWSKEKNALKTKYSAKSAKCDEVTLFTILKEIRKKTLLCKIKSTMD